MHHPLKYAQVERERRCLVRAVPDAVRYGVDIEDASIEGTRRWHLLAEFEDGDDAPTGVPAWLEVVADVTDDKEWTGAGRAARSVDPQIAPG